MTRAFSKEWFGKHQRKLLFLANTVIGRRILCIDGNKSDVGNNKILAILPHAIAWRSSETEISWEFRTHAKFSKRLFYAFYPLWWCLHQWDTLVANIFAPKWNLGFDTLTVFPDADPETATVDGHARQDGSAGPTWAGMRNGAGNDHNDTSTTFVVMIQGDTDTHAWDDFRRGFALFDTSPIGSNVPSAATLSFVVTTVNNPFSDSIVICAGTPDSNTDLVNTDYANSHFGTTNFGEKTYASLVADSSTYNNIALNASGIAAISKTGISKFGFRSKADFDNAEPMSGASGGASCRINVRSAEAAGTGGDPKLVVTHAAAPNNSGFMFMFP